MNPLKAPIPSWQAPPFRTFRDIAQPVPSPCVTFYETMAKLDRVGHISYISEIAERTWHVKII